MALLSVQRIECQFLHCAKQNEQQQQQQQNYRIHVGALSKRQYFQVFDTRHHYLYTHKKAEMEHKKNTQQIKKKQWKHTRAEHLLGTRALKCMLSSNCKW